MSTSEQPSVQKEYLYVRVAKFLTTKDTDCLLKYASKAEIIQIAEGLPALKRIERGIATEQKKIDW